MRSAKPRYEMSQRPDGAYKEDTKDADLHELRCPYHLGDTRNSRRPASRPGGPIIEAIRKPRYCRPGNQACWRGL